MGEEIDSEIIDLIKFYSQTLTGLSSGIFAVVITFLHNFEPLSSTAVSCLHASLVFFFLATLAGLLGIGRIVGIKSRKKEASDPAATAANSSSQTSSLPYRRGIRLPFLLQLVFYILGIGLLLGVALS